MSRQNYFLFIVRVMRLLRSEWRERKIKSTVNAIAPIKNPAANANVPLRLESVFSEDTIAFVEVMEFITGVATTLEILVAIFAIGKLVSGNGGITPTLVIAGSIFGGTFDGATGLIWGTGAGFGGAAGTFVIAK
jgi:hypothetical protein